MTFPTQMHCGDSYRIVHSGEEFAQFAAEGWTAEAEPGKRYIVHTAIPAARYIPSMEEVVAAGYSPDAAERVIERETRLATEPAPAAEAPVSEPQEPPASAPADEPKTEEEPVAPPVASAGAPLIIQPAKRPLVKLRPPVAIVSGNIAPRE